jgi:N-acetylneuraminate synthase
MVDRTRELEYALGSSLKFVAENERETVVVQRRCLRAARDLPAGSLLQADMIEALRPAPPEAVMAFDLPKVLGKELAHNLKSGEHITWASLRDPGTH